MHKRNLEKHEVLGPSILPTVTGMFFRGLLRH